LRRPLAEYLCIALIERSSVLEADACREPTVCPVLGEPRRLGEHPHNHGMRDLDRREHIQYPARSTLAVLSNLEDIAETTFDDDGRMRRLSQVCERQHELPADCGGREICRGLALDDRADLVVAHDGVVANRECSSSNRRVVSAELPGIPLGDICDDLDRSLESACLRDTNPRTRRAQGSLLT